MPAPPKNADTKDIILEKVISRFELELNRKNDLDAKANNLLGFVGIVLTLVSGFGLTYLKLPSFGNLTVDFVLRISPIASFAVILVILLVSLVYILQALQIKTYTFVPNPFNLIGKYENASKETVVQALYDEYAIAAVDNDKMNVKEAGLIKKAVQALLFAFVILGIHSLLVVLSQGVT